MLSDSQIVVHFGVHERTERMFVYKVREAVKSSEDFLIKSFVNDDKYLPDGCEDLSCVCCIKKAVLYLAELCYRTNRSLSQDTLFNKLINIFINVDTFPNIKIICP